jgi:hypothetical protein
LNHVARLSRTLGAPRRRQRALRVGYAARSEDRTRDRTICALPPPMAHLTPFQAKSGELLSARCPQRDSNPRYSLERAVTWAASRWGPGTECRGGRLGLDLRAWAHLRTPIGVGSVNER